MKARDLMVDDWVYNKIIDKPIRVYPTMFSQMFRQNPNLTTEDFGIYPISLTSEILEKNGFEHEKNVGYVYDDNYGTIVVYDTFNQRLKIIRDLNIIFDSQDFADVKVNELQHALHLCKVDKEITM